MKYRLSDLITIIGGGTPKTSIAEYWNGPIPWLSVKDFAGDSKYVYKTEKNITKLGLENSSTKILHKDSIIISARGTVGELAMIPFDMAFNQSCFGIVAGSKLDSHFLYYYLRNCVASLKKQANGSVFDTITKDTFDKIEIELLDINTQKHIASILSAIDEKIETNKALIGNLHSIGETLYSRLIDNASMDKLSSVISEVETGSRPKGGAVNNGYPSIGAEKIEKFGVFEYQGCKYISEEFFEKMKRGVVRSGDVLIYKDGAYTGKCSMALNGYPYERCAVNEHVFIVRSKGSAFQSFLYFTIENAKTKEQLHTLACGKAAQPGLNQQELLSADIPLPKKQHIEEFEELVMPFMNEIAGLSLENKSLAEMRDLLLSKLMSGEIDVSDVRLDS